MHAGPFFFFKKCSNQEIVGAFTLAMEVVNMGYNIYFMKREWQAKGSCKCGICI